jgi:hypothetical protein
MILIVQMEANENWKVSQRRTRTALLSLAFVDDGGTRAILTHALARILTKTAFSSPKERDSEQGIADLSFC